MNNEVYVFIGILYCLVLFYIPFFLVERFNIEKLLMIGGTWAVMFLPGFIWMYLDWNWFLYWFVITFGIIFFWHYIVVYQSGYYPVVRRDERYELTRNSRENDEWYPPTIAEIIKDLKDKR